MTMTLDLLERTITNLEASYSFAEAREIGLFFFKSAWNINKDFPEECWIQVAHDWQLYFFKKNEHYYMSTYRVKDYAAWRVIDSQAPVSTNLLDTRELV